MPGGESSPKRGSDTTGRSSTAPIGASSSRSAGGTRSTSSESTPTSRCRTETRRRSPRSSEPGTTVGCDASRRCRRVAVSPCCSRRSGTRAGHGRSWIRGTPPGRRTAPETRSGLSARCSARSPTSRGFAASTSGSGTPIPASAASATETTHRRTSLPKRSSRSGGGRPVPRRTVRADRRNRKGRPLLPRRSWQRPLPRDHLCLMAARGWSGPASS